MRIFAKVPSLILAAMVTLVANFAQAERYLVIMDHEQQMRSVQSLFDKKRGGSGLSTFASPLWQNVEVTDTLKHLNSLVVTIDSPAAAAAVAALPGVAAIEKEIFYPGPKPVKGYIRTQPWDTSLIHILDWVNQSQAQLGPKTPYGIHLVNAPQAWRGSNYGAGVRILVLDTGIDKEHPALRDNYEQGKDFVGDGNMPYPEADHLGHGTHVAGTIAASLMSDGFVGVAPKATLLAGRVCNQGCSNIAVANGINWGIEQKVDIISMSLGGPFATRGEKQAIEAAEAAGVVVVAASGNDGRKRVSFPAAFPTVLAVGAVDSTPAKADFSNWGPELDIVAPGVGVLSAVPMGSGRESMVSVSVNGNREVVPSAGFAGSPDIAREVQYEVVHVGLGKPEDFKGTSVAGRLALIERGEIAFADKAKNALAAGARGVLIYNNAPGLIQGAVTQDGSLLTIPVVMIEQSVGKQIVQMLAEGTQVRAGIQTLKTDYSEFDGTSMATPHVAGVVALMRAANPGAKPAQVRSVIKATATNMGPYGDNQVGAGLVDAEAAVGAIIGE